MRAGSDIPGNPHLPGEDRGWRRGSCLILTVTAPCLGLWRACLPRWEAGVRYDDILHSACLLRHVGPKLVLAQTLLAGHFKTIEVTDQVTAMIDRSLAVGLDRTRHRQFG